MKNFILVLSLLLVLVGSVVVHAESEYIYTEEFRGLKGFSTKVSLNVEDGIKVDTAGIEKNLDSRFHQTLRDQVPAEISMADDQGDEVSITITIFRYPEGGERFYYGDARARFYRNTYLASKPTGYQSFVSTVWDQGISLIGVDYGSLEADLENAVDSLAESYIDVFRLARPDLTFLR